MPIIIFPVINIRNPSVSFMNVIAAFGETFSDKATIQGDVAKGSISGHEYTWAAEIQDNSTGFFMVVKLSNPVRTLLSPPGPKLTILDAESGSISITIDVNADGVIDPLESMTAPCVYVEL